MLDVIEVSQRVDKGAEFLDDLLGPEWVFRVNLDTLVVASPCNCVIGQLNNGSYWEGVFLWLGVQPISTDDEARPATGRGFDLAEAEDDQENWDLLQSAWVGLITVRRSRINA